MLCEVGCRKVNFEEIWCRKNVELYKSTKYVKILGTRNHILMQDGATEVGNADKMWPHGGQSDAQSSERSDNESRRKQKDAKRKPVEAKRVVCGAQKGAKREPKGHQKCIQKSADPWSGVLEHVSLLGEVYLPLPPSALGHFFGTSDPFGLNSPKL